MVKQDVDTLIDQIGLQAAGKQLRVAGVIFTYRCSIRCRHCLFGCAGDRPDVVMAAEQLALALALLHETGRVVHIAGGEAMLYWEALAEGLKVAHRQDVAPHFIETNCSFAVEDGITARRLEFLAEHGLKGILASTDPYHQSTVPPDRFLRVRRLTDEIFGERNFWGSRAEGSAIREHERIARDEGLLREYVRAHPPVAVGTAHRELAPYLDSYPPDDEGLPKKGWGGSADGPGCLGQFRADTMWELHLDPYGNIQTNCGMVLGALPHATPASILEAGPENANRFVQAVCERGALGLAELAQREYGFEPPERVTQNCELCYLTRSFLRQFHPEVFGPEEIYSAGVI
ncbi:MAG: radical SAM protein [Candidatus Latescibacteria bacterium]|nr:radical SAM protein [Candidatus Latescibacterota bacterium]